MQFAPEFFGGGGSAGYAIADPYSIKAAVGSTESKAVDCLVSVTGKTLSVVFETRNARADIATISDAGITKSETEVSFALPAEVTTVERTLRARVIDTSNGGTVRDVLVFITYQPIGD